MSRERAPFRDDVDLEELSKAGWDEYAAICGEALAHAHALSDETGRARLRHRADDRGGDRAGGAVREDVVGFAEEAAERVRSDHEGFRADHALGAFTRIDVAFR